MEYKIGLISFSVSSIMVIGSGGRDQARDRREERQTQERSQPCIGIDVLAKARCPLGTISMLETRGDPGQN